MAQSERALWLVARGMAAQLQLEEVYRGDLAGSGDRAPPPEVSARGETDAGPAAGKLLPFPGALPPS